MTPKNTDNRPVFACISHASGLLMYAERQPDLAAAIAEYGRQLGAPPSEAAAGLTWYRLPADTKVDHWDAEGDDDAQWAEWDAADPRRIPKFLVLEATDEAIHRAEGGV